MYDPISGRMSQASYSVARNRGLRSKVWSRVTGKPSGLLSLGEVARECSVGARHARGIQTVPIDSIRGSESRCKDFDREFNPIQGHTANRWRNIARARSQGKGLPPVDLIQMGDVYFVLDGHHRISVARALGQLDIEAKVTEWKVDGPLPWEEVEEDGAPSGDGPGDSETGGSFPWVADHALASLRSRVPGGRGRMTPRRAAG
jgi:hypothetical protein